MSLEKESITFGKYKGCELSKMLRDRAYCKWLLEQDWFKNNYEFLYNRLKEYNPSSYFIKVSQINSEDFLSGYEYFNLSRPNELKDLELSNVDKSCYEYYLFLLDTIKEKILHRMENEEENPYNIKAPTNWLKNFEKLSGIPRSDFKDFLEAHDLLNIPYIIERVKKEGGIIYKGAESFNIAKSRSKLQENWWEKILKNKYGEDIGVQFKYEKCIFDFINISSKIIFECKLGLKDFDEEQHKKYLIALKEYRVIYLISTDCLIDMEKRVIYTTKPDKYQLVQTPRSNFLENLACTFEVVKVEDLSILTILN
jgi:hypothetical protein